MKKACSLCSGEKIERVYGYIIILYNVYVYIYIYICIVILSLC